LKIAVSAAADTFHPQIAPVTNFQEAWRTKYWRFQCEDHGLPPQQWLLMTRQWLPCAGKDPGNGFLLYH